MLLDTNFLVDLLAGESSARVFAIELDGRGEPIRIPSPAVFELCTGAARSRTPESELGQIERLARTYEVVPFDARAARQAGVIQGRLGLRGRSLGTVDAEVVGIAVSRSETLVTADERLLALGNGLISVAYR
jgi:tRNA(fMet)-specific endonuclease VapC